MDRFTAVLLLSAGVAIAGCGGGGAARTATTPSTTTSGPVARAPSATAPPGASTVTAPRSRRSPVPGGERPTGVATTFTLRDGRLSPRVVVIPPFVAARISFQATDGRAHTVTIAADRTYGLSLPAGRRTSILFPGQRPGRYPVTVDDARAALAVGAEND